MVLVSIFVTLVFGYSLVSGVLSRTVLTPPILFATAGILLPLIRPEIKSVANSNGSLLWVAEIGLVMLLFTDASRTNLRVLRQVQNLPIRLLTTGILLTIVLGGLAGMAIFPKLGLWEAFILSAILAPTDAGLGQVIVNSPKVPLRIRQALNVEAGLNDGMSVPFMMFFLALALANGQDPNASLARLIWEQLGLGVIAGLAIGFLGGHLLGIANRRKWVAESMVQIGVVTLPLLCAIVSEAVGASMFIAAFVAGLAVQVGFKDAGRHSVEFADEWGQFVNLFVFFLFGMAVARSWHEFHVPMLIYAIISLTLVRMVPVAISLIGTRMSGATMTFMGWFGPRGLASIVLGMVFLEQEAHLPGEEIIRSTVMVTVGFSIFAHGFSAIPGIGIYAKRLARLPADAPENQVPAAETNA
ncbi:MAG: cation:proton antiporter [Candidatus Sumerlaeaceae bacterium]|nr:cation:proton antiporter [Candidatus Sumerlaeaceae bacterium]